MSKDYGQGWQNAPQLNKLAASQQGGSRGAQLWGVQYNGLVNTIYQVTPGGSWSGWLGSDWAGPGYPKQVYELAAAQHKNDCVQFWGLDTELQIWSTVQSSPGGSWEAWSGPNWNNSPVGIKRLTACRQGNARDTQLWGISKDLTIISCYQPAGGSQWTTWQNWPTPAGIQFMEIVAVEQNSHGQLWALDTKRQLWATWQSDVGGSWYPLRGPNWEGAPNLANITACQQGGTRGTQIWGINSDYNLISNYQITPGGKWNGWSQGSWMNAPQVYEITAAEQNNGCMQLWALTMDLKLISISQTSPGGDDWGEWQSV